MRYLKKFEAQRTTPAQMLSLPDSIMQNLKDICLELTDSGKFEIYFNSGPIKIGGDESYKNYIHITKVFFNKNGEVSYEDAVKFTLSEISDVFLRLKDYLYNSFFDIELSPAYYWEFTKKYKPSDCRMSGAALLVKSTDEINKFIDLPINSVTIYYK